MKETTTVEMEPIEVAQRVYDVLVFRGLVVEGPQGARLVWPLSAYNRNRTMRVLAHWLDDDEKRWVAAVADRRVREGAASGPQRLLVPCDLVDQIAAKKAPPRGWFARLASALGWRH